MMRILFFMPRAGRTGSEVALYNLICHAAGKGFKVAVACADEGELLNQLPADVPVFVYEKWGRARRTYAGVFSRLMSEDNSFTTSIHRKFKPDLWYINTVMQSEFVRQAKSHNIPCVVHTHELEQVLSGLTEADTRTLISFPRLVIASSRAARDVFFVLGRRDNIEVCYSTIDPKRISWSSEKSKEIRRSLGVGDDTFVWATAGSLDPNKNPVRFVEIAAEMLAQSLDVHFMWLGQSVTGYGLYAREKARDLGLDGKVNFTGALTDEYYDYLNAADGLVVTSFQESFSIVTAEAAYLGKPVVAFDCGGVSEIVREGMGTIVGSWNSADMIRAMVATMRGETSFDPRRARERVKEFYVETQGARWEGIMRDYFGRDATLAPGQP